MKRTTLFLAFVMTLLQSKYTVADDWPQWRGPNRDGVSAETGLLKQWPTEGPKLLWQVDNIGEGYSTPSVVGDRIYLQSNQGLDDEFVETFDAADGQRIWSTRIGEVGNPRQQPSYPGARCAPTIDGDRLYALGSDGKLVCLNATTGTLHWEKDLRIDFQGKPGIWAYAESPLVEGDSVICTPGGKAATMVALDKQSGDVIWKATVQEDVSAAYSSPVVLMAGGVKQYVQFLGDRLVGVSAATGDILWRYDRTAESRINIPTPIVFEHCVYSANYRPMAAAIQITTRNGRVEIMEMYSNPKLPGGIGGAVRVGDYLYGTRNRNLLCSDFKTGQIKWSTQSPVGPASVMFADGSLYLRGESGGVALVEATPTAFRLRGKFELADVASLRAYAHPVIANGRLYIRDAGTLRCYGISESSTHSIDDLQLMAAKCANEGDFSAAIRWQYEAVTTLRAQGRPTIAAKYCLALYLSNQPYRGDRDVARKMALLQVPEISVTTVVDAE